MKLSLDTIRRDGLKDIEANVTQGTLEEAKWLSVSANKRHGLPRSNHDKVRAVRTALQHPKGAKSSDSAIAKHVGVSQPFVGKVRSELAVTYNGYKSTARTGRDGRTIEPPENIIHVDGNCPRRTSDRMSLGRTLGTVRADELATLRAMLGGFSMTSRRRTVHEEMQLLEKHRDAVHFAHEHLPTTRPAGLANSMTRAVVARAWYCVTGERMLVRFCEVLRSGMPATDEERVIVLLRDELLGLKNQRTTSAARQRQYALTSRALLAYVNGESLSLLRPPSYDLFLLPEDVPSAVSPLRPDRRDAP